ncbi:MAG TPA: hypothetical protein PLX33_11510 [Alphaproteobacteria bacterium]|nr:hypothetical protein [Alphaproteobacteria bacterium]
MPTFPDTLPAPLANSFQEQPANNIVRTQMDVGPAKVRRRTTSNVSSIRVAYVLSAAQVDEIQTFFAEDTAGGALGFDFTHPRTGATVTARFNEPPQYASMNGLYYQVTVSLEVLP